MQPRVMEHVNLNVPINVGSRKPCSSIEKTQLKRGTELKSIQLLKRRIEIIEAKFSCFSKPYVYKATCRNLEFILVILELFYGLGSY